MPITDNSIVTELDNLTVTTDPQTYNYDTLTAVDTDRSAASQIVVLAYFTTFADGSAVTDYTWTNWYDPFLIPLNDTSGNIFLTFNDALKQVTLSNISTSVATHTTGSKNRPVFDGSNYTKVRLMRSQNLNSKATLFNPGGRITSTALNNAVDQLFTSCQELEDRLVNVEGATFEQGILLNSTDLPTIPVNKGGTGATTVGAARTALGADNAANLTSGTIPNARITGLPKGNILAAADDIINRTVGTSANNVVSLDSFGKLPQLDGSNLINLPGSGPGGSGDMTGVDITAGNGIDITQSNTTSGNYTATLSADLKANGGIVIESTEMGVDLGASAITGTLAVADGGTGLTSLSTLLNSNTTKSDVGLSNVTNIVAFPASGVSTFGGTLIDDTSASDARTTLQLGTAATTASTDYAASSHNQALSTITGAGTAAALDVPSSGNAASGEVVKGSDTRLTNDRTPVAHSADLVTTGVLGVGRIPTITLSKISDSGTAAALDTGTGSGNVVVLDSNGALPIVDGSNLTNITGTGGLANVVEETTPQLGGNLDVQARTITTSTTNGDIEISPNGNGNVVVEPPGSGFLQVEGTTNPGKIRLMCEAGSHGVGLISPAHTEQADYDLTLPVATGAANKALIATDSNGTLGWSSALGTAAAAATGDFSPVAGSTSITTVGTITNGTWSGTAITYASLNGKPSLGTASQYNAGIGSNNILQADANVADDDFLRVAGTKIEGRTAAEVLSDIGADNASNLTSGTIPTARITTGTSGQDIVQLDNASRLPAVDGSQLTNLPAPANNVTSPAMTGVSAGSITGIIQCDSAEYAAITPDPNTLYVIV